jgi:hemolysin III
MAIAEPIGAPPARLAPKPRLRGFFHLVAFYLALGWVAVAVLPRLWREGGPAIVWLIIAGGVGYTAGAVVHACRRPDPVPAVFGYHEIVRLGTIVGFAAHHAAVTLALV